MTWRFREIAATGVVAGAADIRGPTQPLPPRRLEAAARAARARSKRASVFGSAQFSRPPWIDASESTTMNGAHASGPRGPSSSDGDASTSR